MISTPNFSSTPPHFYLRETLWVFSLPHSLFPSSHLTFLLLFFPFFLSFSFFFFPDYFWKRLLWKIVEPANGMTALLSGGVKPTSIPRREGQPPPLSLANFLLCWYLSPPTPSQQCLLTGPFPAVAKRAHSFPICKKKPKTFNCFFCLFKLP